MRFLFWLLLGQTAGILIAGVMAVINIESIVASGPILSLSGVFVAFLSFHRDRLLGFLFGLATPTVAAFCLFVIVVREWSPDQAHVPVGAFLVVFGLLSIPACALAVSELHSAGDERPRAYFQYSIAAMLILMLVLALVLGMAQAAGEKGAAAGVLLAYLVALLYVIRQFFDSRRMRKLSKLSSFLERRESTADSPFD